MQRSQGWHFTYESSREKSDNSKFVLSDYWPYCIAQRNVGNRFSQFSSCRIFLPMTHLVICARGRPRNVKSATFSLTKKGWARSNNSKNRKKTIWEHLQNRSLLVLLYFSCDVAYFFVYGLWSRLQKMREQYFDNITKERISFFIFANLFAEM